MPHSPTQGQGAEEDSLKQLLSHTGASRQVKTGRQDSGLQWLRRLIPEHSSINILGVQRRPLFLPVSPVGLPRDSEDTENWGLGNQCGKTKEPWGSQSPSVDVGPSGGYSEGSASFRKSHRRSAKQQSSSEHQCTPAQGSEVTPNRVTVMAGRWPPPTDPHLCCPQLLPWPSCFPLATPPGPPGRAGARAARGRRSPPKRSAPAPGEQAQQDAMRGSLEAFREEHSPGTSPAGRRSAAWSAAHLTRAHDS